MLIGAYASGAPPALDRGRHGLETRGRNLLPAFDADAVLAGLDPAERRLDPTHFNESGRAEMLKNFIALPLGRPIFVIGVRRLVEIVLDRMKTHIEFPQAGVEAGFVLRYVHHASREP